MEPRLDTRNCPRIGEEDNILLEAPFDAHEILESIGSHAGNKAPGPDGYSIMAFFSQFLEPIRDDLVAAVKYFHETGYFEKSIVATFVALIPKKVGGQWSRVIIDPSVEVRESIRS